MTLRWREGRIYVVDNGINGKIRQLIDRPAIIKRFWVIHTGRHSYVITLINTIAREHLAGCLISNVDSGHAATRGVDRTRAARVGGRYFDRR